MNSRKRTSGKAAKAGKVLPFPSGGVVRLTRVAEARRRIESGWYDRADVRDRLAKAVLLELRGR
jgi:hypothetical protein